MQTLRLEAVTFYLTTRTRTKCNRQQRRRFAPRTVWLLWPPRVGRPMTLVDAQGRPRVTTKILRILQAGEQKALYVQTRNSVYQLCPSPLRPEDDLHTREDTSSTG